MLVPWYIFWLWPLLLLVIAGLAAACFQFGKKESSWWQAVGYQICGMVGALAAVAILALGASTILNGRRGVIVDEGGNILDHVPAGFYLVNSLAGADYQLDDPYVTDLDQSVSLLVADPYIVKINCHYRVEVGRTESALVQAVRSFGQLKEYGWGYLQLQKYVTGLIYEFNHARSDQLRQLYNPEDPKQQATFAQVAHQALDAELAEHGLVLTKATFDVSN